LILHGPLLEFSDIENSSNISTDSSLPRLYFHLD
jgi:hypothetical protein